MDTSYHFRRQLFPTPVVSVLFLRLFVFFLVIFVVTFCSSNGERKIDFHTSATLPRHPKFIDHGGIPQCLFKRKRKRSEQRIFSGLADRTEERKAMSSEETESVEIIRRRRTSTAHVT